MNPHQKSVDEILKKEKETIEKEKIIERTRPQFQIDDLVKKLGDQKK